MKARQSEKAKRLLADPAGRRQLREFAMGQYADEGVTQPSQAPRLTHVDPYSDRNALKVRPRLVPYGTR